MNAPQDEPRPGPSLEKADAVDPARFEATRIHRPASAESGWDATVNPQGDRPEPQDAAEQTTAFRPSGPAAPQYTPPGGYPSAPPSHPPYPQASSYPQPPTYGQPAPGYGPVPPPSVPGYPQQQAQPYPQPTAYPQPNPYPQPGGYPQQVPYPQQNPYPQQAYPQPYGPPPYAPYGPQSTGQTQTWSIVSFVCIALTVVGGVAFCFLPCLITGPAGIVLGFVGHSKGEPLGKWAAIANGVVLLLMILLVVLVIGIAGMGSSLS